MATVRNKNGVGGVDTHYAKQPKIKVVTQAQYDALTPQENVVYVIAVEA